MQILPRHPDALTGRHLPGSVAVKCNCGEYFLWPLSGGNQVRCPTCKLTAELDVTPPEEAA